MDTSSVSEWLSTATNFRGKYAEFLRLLNALSTATIDPVKYPELAKERETLIGKGTATNNKISGTVAAIENTYSAVKEGYKTAAGTAEMAWELVTTEPLETFSRSWGMLTDWVDDKLSGIGGLDALGILPALIPVAVIAGSLTAISYWITDAQKFQAKIEEQKRLEAQGIDPRQAANMVERKFGTVGGKLIGDLGTVAKLAGIAGILFIGYKIAKQTKLLKG